MEQYYTVDYYIEYPKSSRVKQAYSDWQEGEVRYETLKEANEEFFHPCENAKRIVCHTSEVVIQSGPNEQKIDKQKQPA